jgi:hypothetical protein
MAGQEVSFLELFVAGAMITSNGWIDVLLYAITRRALIFGSHIPDDRTRALETFTPVRLRPDLDSYGTTTTIESDSRIPPRQGKSFRGMGKALQSRESQEELFGCEEGMIMGRVVKAETVVQVRSEAKSARRNRVEEILRSQGTTMTTTTTSKGSLDESRKSVG